MARKIYVKETVDMETGELITIQSVTSNPFTEIFSMFRRTEGIGWIFDFTGNELQLMFALSEFERSLDENNVIILTSMDKELLAGLAGYSIRYLNKVLSSLVSKKALFKSDSEHYYLNPTFVFQGDSKKIPLRIEAYRKFWELTPGIEIQL